MPALQFPLRKQIAYACGMIGWSIMTNIIIVMLPYFYLPPSNAGLTPLIPQLMLFGVLNILSVIAASGRFVDAILRQIKDVGDFQTTFSLYFDITVFLVLNIRHG